MSQGWKLKGGICPVLYSDTVNGYGVGRDDLWLATTDALKSAQPVEVQRVLYIGSAAKILAECMDYPWAQMPEQGRETMRVHALSVVNAALGIKPASSES